MPQVVTRERTARPGLEAVVDKIQRVLEGVCREVQRQARLYQESVRDQAELQVRFTVGAHTLKMAHCLCIHP